MQGSANKGLGAVVWLFIVTIAVLFILGVVLWWYDAYWLHE